jgi:hypothetical protein
LCAKSAGELITQAAILVCELPVALIGCFEAPEQGRV